jgi:hypothetical protein
MKQYFVNIAYQAFTILDSIINLCACILGAKVAISSIGEAFLFNAEASRIEREIYKSQGSRIEKSNAALNTIKEIAANHGKDEKAREDIQA